jgi:hypothetical protein
MNWCGVGNVEAVLFHTDPQAQSAKEVISTRGGVLGCRLPPLKVATLRIWPGDLLVLASDGIRSGFADAVELDQAPHAIAKRILSGYGRDSDDALVVAARYNGAP